MNPEIRRLQYLNDLIAQTLDVINQRVASQVPMGGGLSHSPYGGGVSPFQQQGVSPWQGQGIPPMQQQMDPRFQPIAGQMGLSHSPYPHDPRLGLDPRFGVQQGFDPRFTQPMVPQSTMGLSHTAYDPRLGVGAAPVWGADPRLMGYPFIW